MGGDSGKSSSSTGGDSMWLNMMVWGHQLMGPKWIVPKTLDNIPVVEGDMFLHCVP